MGCISVVTPLIARIGYIRRTRGTPTCILPRIGKQVQHLALSRRCHFAVLFALNYRPSDCEGVFRTPRVTPDTKTFAAGGTLSAYANCGTVQKLPDQKFLDEIDGIYNSYNLYELAEGTEQVIFVGGAPRRRSEDPG